MMDTEDVKIEYIYKKKEKTLVGGLEAAELLDAT